MGLTKCVAGECAAPVEVSDCSTDENACDANTNGLTKCVAGECAGGGCEDSKKFALKCPIWKSQGECIESKKYCTKTCHMCPAPVEDCSTDENACDGNANGLTACVAGICAAPVEIAVCTDGGDECADNTNSLTTCLNDACVAPVEIA